MNDLILKLKLLVKTEMTLGKLQARRTANQVVFSVIALFFVLLGLGMLNFAGYQSCIIIFSPALSALLIAIADILIGAVILGFAARTNNNSDEEKMAQEIREMVYSELGADVDAVKTEFTKVTDDVNRIRLGFSALTSGSGSVSGVVAFAPLIELLTKAVNKKKAK